MPEPQILRNETSDLMLERHLLIGMACALLRD
jgi:hypothetical protein